MTEKKISNVLALALSIICLTTFIWTVGYISSNTNMPIPTKISAFNA